jgi:hypothetical protein
MSPFASSVIPAAFDRSIVDVGALDSVDISSFSRGAEARRIEHGTNA